MRLDLKSLFFGLLLFNHGVSITKAALQTITIDDTYGDEVTHGIPTYLPTAETNPIVGSGSPWAGPECTGCAIQPDPKQAHNGTWHAATYHPAIQSISIEFPFTGTSVNVYFIIPHTQQYITTDVACNFTVDGKLVKTFLSHPTDPNAITYNFLAFSQSGLDNVAHTMKIETGNGYNLDAFVAFDYATYTYDDSAGPLPTTVASSASPTSTQTTGSSTSSTGAVVPTNSGSGNNGNGSKHTNVAAIAGGVVGGVGIVVLLALLFLLLSRRKRSSSSPEMGPEMAPSAYYTGHGPAPGTAATAAGSFPPSHYRDTKFQPNVTSPTTTASTALSPNRYVPPAPSSTAGTSQSGMTSATLTAADEKASLRTRETTDELKRARQRELQRQLQAVKAEMRALQSDLQESEGGAGALAERTVSVRSQTRGREGGNDQEVVDLREQIRVMSEQMETLRLQQDSAWAQGLSDEPPPGYTPHAPQPEL